MIKRTILVLLALLGFALTFYFRLGAAFEKWSEKAKVPANEHTAKFAPVVAVSGGKISLFPYIELSEYSQSNPDYTFLIPENQEESLRLQLQNLPREKGVDASWKFMVERRSPDSQLIHATAFGDSVYESWYEARDKSIEVQYVKILGKADIFPIAVDAFRLTGYIWIPIFALLILYMRKVKRRR
jgi:hypothetical protein